MILNLELELELEYNNFIIDLMYQVNNVNKEKEIGAKSGKDYLNSGKITIKTGYKFLY